MKTLNKNYQKNIDILKENIKRGMTKEQAKNIIEQMENSFINANLYKQEEKAFIQEMRSVIGIIRANDFMRSLGINVVEIK